jgi:hypothetical protein
MPIRKTERSRYPSTWNIISMYVRFVRANNKCEFCQCENYKPHPITGSRVVLTVAHMDHTPENVSLENLKALCQLCHNRYDRNHRALTRLSNRIKKIN